MKYLAISLGVLVVIGSGIFFFARHTDQSDPSYVNAVLAIRGFRHAEQKVSAGETIQYRVGVGEEFKIAWQAVHQTEPGQIIYQGPTGIGAGIIPIPIVTPSGATSAVTFTPTHKGTAIFALSATGPGPDNGTYTITSTITLTVE